MSSRFPWTRVLTLAVTLFLALFALVLMVSADSIAVDFEGYSLGTVDGQDGWQSDGAAGSGCAVYDHEVVANTYGYATFGTKSLRMSNAVTSGCFSDQTFSKSTTDEAGETSAANDGKSGGTRQPYFEAQWDFASTVPGAEQPGLSTVASPDRGDGARMSWVQMTDTPTGLAVNFNDYDRTLDPTCATGDGFVQTNLVSDLDRTVPHTIKITMEFVDGIDNDIVQVYVDGILEITAGSWEDYFRDCEGNPTRTVDSILFRTGGAAAPATDGFGFVIDNLTVTTGAVPPPPPPLLYISPNMKNGVVDGVAFDDQDILVNELGTSDWEKFFDGSTFGITKNLTDFAFDAGDCLLMVFNGNQKLGSTIYTPRDVAQFCPTVPGDYTAGTFSMYFDGSDVGLTTKGEIIDALDVLSDGRLIISPKGVAKVPQNGVGGVVNAQKNDILVFNYTAYGPATTGYWDMYLDNILVAGMNKENIISAYTDGGDSYMTFWANYSVGDETGDYNDIVVIHPDYSADVFWDGDDWGYSGRIHGLHITGD